MILLGGGGAAAYRQRAQSGGPVITVTTEKAEVRTLTQVVTASGKIQPEVEVKISTEAR